MKEKSSSNNYSGGVGFLGLLFIVFLVLLFIVFLVLKLTGYIAWSWWWVSAPLWAPLWAPWVLVVLVFVGILFGYLGVLMGVVLYHGLKALWKKVRN